MTTPSDATLALCWRKLGLGWTLAGMERRLGIELGTLDRLLWHWRARGAPS